MSESGLNELSQLVERFCDIREWDQFHHAKDLAIGIVTEGSELLELFRFKSEKDVDLMLSSEGTRGQVALELADVFYFLLRFSSRYRIDLEAALREKMRINESKYPVDVFRGRNAKYTEP